jgi:hypothetical protein
MNYIVNDNKYQITEQGRRQIRSLLAGKNLSQADLSLALGWNYQRLYRILRGMQYATEQEFSEINSALVEMTGRGIEEADLHNVGRLS